MPGTDIHINMLLSTTPNQYIFLPHQYLYGKLPVFRHAELRQSEELEEFAHLGGYTTTTFRRMFKNMYGVPVYEWILDKKREGILNDLQYTKQRISVISARYGFDSLSHFAHFCKDSFGDLSLIHI